MEHIISARAFHGYTRFGTLNRRRKQAYNRWIAACQTFNQMVRGQ